MRLNCIHRPLLHVGVQKTAARKGHRSEENPGTMGENGMTELSLADNGDSSISPKLNAEPNQTPTSLSIEPKYKPA